MTFKGFAEAAKQLVETVADDARVLRLPADGTTLVIENRDQDSYSRDRLESITSALKAAGGAYDIVSFDGEQKGATEVVLEYLKTHPKLTVILADHDFGVAGAFDAREQWKKTNKNIFAIGGYFACDVRLTQSVKNHVQGLVDRNVEGYARKATPGRAGLDGRKAGPRARPCRCPLHPYSPALHSAPQLGRDRG